MYAGQTDWNSDRPPWNSSSRFSLELNIALLITLYNFILILPSFIITSISLYSSLASSIVSVIVEILTVLLQPNSSYVVFAMVRWSCFDCFAAFCCYGTAFVCSVCLMLFAWGLMASGIPLSFRHGDACFLKKFPKGNPEAFFGLLAEDSLLLDNCTMTVFFMLAFILRKKIFFTTTKEHLNLINTQSCFHLVFWLTYNRPFANTRWTL